MNIELLEKVKEQIMLEPKLFDMDNWEEGGEDGDLTEEQVCNTAHCICGWAAVIKYKKSFFAAMEEWDRDNYFEDEFGMDILDLPNTDLFFTSYWPKHFQDKYYSYKQPLRRARVACEVIDDYIETGGWENE